ncbi:MAG: arginase, partial [Gaiellales bacterium]|nr:arginase [Gaiellales bacterium]
MSTPRRIALIGVPLDLGQGRRGVDMGPSAIRYAGLASRLRGIGYEVDDRGDISVPRADACAVGAPNAK